MTAGKDARARIELVIFDCDGVLVDSEPISVDVLMDAIARAGLRLDPEIGYRRFLGRSMASVAAFLRVEHGLALTEAMLAEMNARLFARFRRELRAVPGVGAAIDRLGRPCCVASSSQPERIRLSLELTGLAPRFGERIFSASMVPEGKPAPDLFLRAAAEMGAAPEACLVVEDSPAGIEAARRAGMRVLAFTGGSHAGPSGLEEAARGLRPDAIFADFALLDGLLRDLEAGGGAPGSL